MLRRLSITTGAALVALFVAAHASAVPIDPLNVRPAAGVTAGQLTGLQSILDDLYGCTGCVDATSDQQTAGAWALPGSLSGVTAPTLQVQSGAFLNQVSFGIWSGSDTSAITTVEIFDGGSSPFSTATLQWLPGDASTVNIYGGAGVNVGAHAGINRYNFGFYIDSPDSGGVDSRYWSVDQLNDGGLAQMLAYVGGGNTWALAWEDLNRTTGSDNNFYDLVVTTESIVPVPEPGSLALFGAGLIGLVSAARRRVRSNVAA